MPSLKSLKQVVSKAVRTIELSGDDMLQWEEEQHLRRSIRTGILSGNRCVSLGRKLEKVQTPIPKQVITGARARFTQLSRLCRSMADKL